MNLKNEEHPESFWKPQKNIKNYQLNIKLNPDMDLNTREYYKNYKSSAYEGDSGFDLPLSQDIKISKNRLETINFGITCSMTKVKKREYIDDSQYIDENNKYMAENIPISYYLYPRSSISSMGIMLANSVGIIDQGYRGHIMAKIRYIPICTNFLWELFWSWWPSSKSLKKGTKLFQICAPNLEPFTVNIVDELDSTERGSNGFGSSGI